MVEAIADDYQNAALSHAKRAMLDFAHKLTLSPAGIGTSDVEALRQAGHDDVAIHDITQVTAYFNYINRIADGLGVDPEPL